MSKRTGPLDAIAYMTPDERTAVIAILEQEGHGYRDGQSSERQHATNLRAVQILSAIRKSR